MTTLNFTLEEALTKLKSGEVSSVELTKDCLKAIEAQKDLNAFLEVTEEHALGQAQASDEKRSKGDAGLLEGIPLAIKDLFCTKGFRTTAGSHMLENFVAPYESTVTQGLWDAGAVMLGKTNMDEFAMGSSNETSYFGPAKSPWKSKEHSQDITAGGSSGGSSSAVAARLCFGATGSDTGGSIRQPAAFTGIVGLKPTYGRCSRWGMVSFASSLDQAGPLTRSVRDSALMLQATAGYDPKDSTSAKVETPDFMSAFTGDIRGLRVGIPKEYRVDNMPQEIDAHWVKCADYLKAAGAEVVEVSLPHTSYALPTYYIIAPAEASSNFARYDGVRYGLRVEEGDSLDDMYTATRTAGFGDEVKQRIMIGTYVLSAGYYDAFFVKALKVRRLIRQDFDQAFEKVDVLLTPTAPSTAFALGNKDKDPIAMYLNDVFTVPASLAGMPAISLPSGIAQDGLPLGMQLIGRPFDEVTMLRTAEVLEKAVGFTHTPFEG